MQTHRLSSSSACAYSSCSRRAPISARASASRSAPLDSAVSSLAVTCSPPACKDSTRLVLRGGFLRHACYPLTIALFQSNLRACNLIQSNPTASILIQLNLIQSNPIQLHPIQFNRIQSHQIQSHRIQSHRIQSHPTQFSPIQSSAVLLWHAQATWGGVMAGFCLSKRTRSPAGNGIALTAQSSVLAAS